MVFTPKIVAIWLLMFIVIFTLNKPTEGGHGEGERGMEERGERGGRRHRHEGVKEEVEEGGRGHRHGGMKHHHEEKERKWKLGRRWHKHHANGTKHHKMGHRHHGNGSKHHKMEHIHKMNGSRHEGKWHKLIEKLRRRYNYKEHGGHIRRIGGHRYDEERIGGHRYEEDRRDRYEGRYYGRRGEEVDGWRDMQHQHRHHGHRRRQMGKGEVLALGLGIGAAVVIIITITVGLFVRRQNVQKARVSDVKGVDNDAYEKKQIESMG